MECIQGLWVGDSLGLIQELSIRSYIYHGHSFELYVYDPVQNVPEGVIIRDASKILPKADIFCYKSGFGKGSYAGFANLFRFKLLLECGGLWSDLDVVCLKPVQLDQPYAFSSERSKAGGVKINNTFMKAVKQSEIMRECFKKSLLFGHENLEWRMNGSDVLQDCIRKLRMEDRVLAPDVICPLDYWRYEDVMKRNKKFDFKQETYAVHLWNQMWERKWRKSEELAPGQEKERLVRGRDYDSSALFGRLLNRYMGSLSQRQMYSQFYSDGRELCL